MRTIKVGEVFVNVDFIENVDFTPEITKDPNDRRLVVDPLSDMVMKDDRTQTISTPPVRIYVKGCKEPLLLTDEKSIGALHHFLTKTILIEV